MIKIWHPELAKTVEVKDVMLKINKTFDDNGKPIKQEYVEFTVLGRNNNYQDGILLAQFVRYNPEVSLSDKRT